MPEFKKYSSITNHFRKNTIDYWRDEFFDGTTSWLVTEKIHGANFQIMMGRDGVMRFGTRSGFLGEGDKFHNYREVIGERALEQFRGYCKTLMEEWDDMESVTLYGELFGGGYPDINSSCKMVQRGVYYSPNVEFMVFDIKVNDLYLHAEKFLQDMKEHLDAFKVVPVIQITPELGLDEVVNIESRYQSEVYKAYGLPKVEDNMCEGVVVRPFLFDGRFGETGGRMIIKKKNEGFEEKCATNAEVSFNEDLVVRVVGELVCYLNENRLNAVYSKRDWSDCNFGDFIKDVLVDIYADANEDDLYMEFFEVGDRKEINKRLSNMIVIAGRPVFFDDPAPTL